MLHLYAKESATKVNLIGYDQLILRTKDKLRNTMGVDLFLSIFHKIKYQYHFTCIFQI